jgi:hypothetical protein
MYIDSQCSHCNGVNHVKHNGHTDIVVHCDHCKKYYDHVLYSYSRVEFNAKDEKIIKLEEMIVERVFYRASKRSVLCLIVFNNGLEQEGRSTVKNEDDFRMVIGKDKAYEDALKRALVVMGAIL